MLKLLDKQVSHLEAEIEKLNREQIALLAGLAPLNNDSGKSTLRAEADRHRQEVGTLMRLTPKTQALDKRVGVHRFRPRAGQLRPTLILCHLWTNSILDRWDDPWGSVQRAVTISLPDRLSAAARSVGKSPGKRSIKGGRQSVRNVLDMAAITAKKHNPVIKAFAARLENSGQEFKVVITACMRKLLTIANALVKSNTPWTNTLALATP